MIMMRLLLAFILSLPQGPALPSPGPGPRGGVSGSVSVQNHSMSATWSTGCNNTTACTENSLVVGNTGDAALFSLGFCTDASCVTNAATLGCTVTVGDGTHTYTRVTAASNTTGVGGGFWNVYPFVLANAPAGTYHIDVAISGAGCTFIGATWTWIDFKGANTTTPVDSSVSATSAGTSATPSVVSAGNVSAANEVAFCYMTGSTTIAVGGSYTKLDNTTNEISADLVNPSSGSTTTCSGTQTSHSYWMSLLAIQP